VIGEAKESPNVGESITAEEVSKRLADMARDIQTLAEDEEGCETRARALEAAMEAARRSLIKCGQLTGEYPADPERIEGMARDDKPVAHVIQWPAFASGTRTEAYCDDHLNDLWNLVGIEGDNSNVDAFFLWETI
jgi:hypothetical protein